MKTQTFWVKSFNICWEEFVGLESLIFFPLYELYWLLTTRHLTANIFSCIPIFLDNDFCKTINLFIIDIYACSVYLEEKAPVENKQTSINKKKKKKRKTLISHIFPMKSPFFDIYMKAHKIMQTTLFLMFRVKRKAATSSLFLSILHFLK